MSTVVMVWDLPTRVFHWVLVACFAGLMMTGLIGGDALDWHFRLGYLMLCLLLFRLVWGVIGGYWSRFSNFNFSPAAVRRYLTGAQHPTHGLGHSPMGAGSVIAMLTLLSVQVASGLVSDDEIANAGPLSRFVSGATVARATFYHAEVGKWILIGLVLLHLGAILFYLFKRGRNLVWPMIRGTRVTNTRAPASRDDGRSRVLAVAVLLGCVGLLRWLASLVG